MKENVKRNLNGDRFMYIFTITENFYAKKVFRRFLNFRLIILDYREEIRYNFFIFE